MTENCICEALAAAGLIKNRSLVDIPSHCEGSCSCQDSRFFAPECAILESEYIYRTDIIAYSFFLILNFLLFCAIVAEFGLVISNTRKRQKESIKYTSSNTTYFSLIATLLMILTEVFMMLYYSFRIHDSYVIEAEVGKVGRLITIGMFGVGLTVTLAFVSITWLEIMASVKAMKRTALRVPKTVIFVAIGLLGPVAIATSVAVPLLSSDGNIALARVMGIINGFVTAGILIVLLVMMAPRARRVRSWISKQDADPHSLMDVASQKTNYVICMLFLIVFVLILVVLRMIVSVITHNDPRYRIALETISLATQFSAIALSLRLVSKYIVGLKVGFCPFNVTIVPVYTTNSARKSTHSSSPGSGSSSAIHTTIPESTQSTDVDRTIFDGSTTTTVELPDNSSHFSTSESVFL